MSLMIFQNEGSTKRVESGQDEGTKFGVARESGENAAVERTGLVFFVRSSLQYAYFCCLQVPFYAFEQTTRSFGETQIRYRYTRLLFLLILEMCFLLLLQLALRAILVSTLSCTSYQASVVCSFSK